MCFKRPDPVTDIFAVHVVPFSLVSYLLRRTVTAAIHWVALVPGINTVWPPVCLCACVRDFECVSVCVCAREVSLLHIVLFLLIPARHRCIRSDNIWVAMIRDVICYFLNWLGKKTILLSVNLAIIISLFIMVDTPSPCIWCRAVCYIMCM